MIEVRQGDALSIDQGIIVHGCNCRGVMGGGIARTIRDRYPYAYEVYKNDEAANGLELGYLSYAEVSPNKFIVNAYTQQDFGTDRRQVNYEAIAVCFEKVVELALDLFNQRGILLPIVFPKIGAGLAGGDWEIIEKIIDRTVPDQQTEGGILYEFKKILYVL